MRLRFVWLGMSLFISSGIIAYVVSLIMGEPDAFGVVFGVDMISNIVCFIGGGVLVGGAKAKPKPKAG